MKKFIFITLIFFFLFLSLHVIQSTPDLGLLDEAGVISENERKLGGTFSLSLLVTTTLLNISHPQQSFSILPLFYKDHLIRYSVLIVPSFSFSFIDIIGLKKNTEFSYRINITTPSIHKQDLYGPNFFIDFGLKKKFFNNKSINLAYKFAWALGYNAYPGFDLAVKNSLLLGTNNEKINFNFIPFIQDSIIIGLSPLSIMYDYVLNSSPIVTIVPGIELNWNLRLVNDFIFVVGLCTKYEFNFELYYKNFIQGNFIMGLHFAWMGKKSKSKNIELTNEDFENE